MPKITFDFDTSPYDSESFDYEPEYSDLKRVLITSLKEDYPTLTEDDLDHMLDESLDKLVDEYEMVLQDHFRDDAREQYEDAKAYEKDPYAYYGVSRRDFF